MQYGTIKKITLTIAPPKLTPQDIKELEEATKIAAAGNDAKHSLVVAPRA